MNPYESPQTSPPPRPGPKLLTIVRSTLQILWFAFTVAGCVLVIDWATEPLRVASIATGYGKLVRVVGEISIIIGQLALWVIAWVLGVKFIEVGLLDADD